MKKKSLGFTLSLLLVLSALAGCQGNDSSSSTNNGNDSGSSSSTPGVNKQSGDTPVTIKYVIPGTEPSSWPEVKDAVNKKLLADGVNVQIDEQYIDWSQWDQKLNLMLSTGQDIDLYHVMHDIIPISNYIARGAAMDITSLLNQYGPNIKKIISSDTFKTVTKDGKQYGIPTDWYEMAVLNVFESNDYLLKKYGVDNHPKTPQEMLDDMEKLYNAAPAPKPQFPVLTSVVSSNGMDFLHRSFDSYPFDVRDGIAMITKDGKVKNWVESDEFKQESAFLRQAYQKKLISPDVLTLKVDQWQKQTGSFNWGFIQGTTSNSQSELDNNLPGATLDDFSLQGFNPEKGSYRFSLAKDWNVVAPSSKHPEAVIKFLNWLYANQTNYDLFMYGFEGKTFKKVGDRGLEAMVDPQTKKSLIPNTDWMIGNLHYIREPQTIIKGTRAIYQQNPNAKNFISAGFFFDSNPVKTEIGNVNAVITSDVAPIYAGVVDYDSQIKQVQAKLKAAGVDKVIVEYQKQLDAYLSAAAK